MESLDCAEWQLGELAIFLLEYFHIPLPCCSNQADISNRMIREHHREFSIIKEQRTLPEYQD